MPNALNSTVLWRLVWFWSVTSVKPWLPSLVFRILVCKECDLQFCVDCMSAFALFDLRMSLEPLLEEQRITSPLHQHNLYRSSELWPSVNLSSAEKSSNSVCQACSFLIYAIDYADRVLKLYDTMKRKSCWILILGPALSRSLYWSAPCARVG